MIALELEGEISSRRKLNAKLTEEAFDGQISAATRSSSRVEARVEMHKDKDEDFFLVE